MERVTEESQEQFDPYYMWLGIPPADQPPNYYRLLGIPPFEQNPTVIGNAADRQMAHLRTFQAGEHSAESQKLLNEVTRAKICLLNPQKKLKYDEELHNRSVVVVETLGRVRHGVETAVPPAAIAPPGATPDEATFFRSIITEAPLARSSQKSDVPTRVQEEQKGVSKRLTYIIAGTVAASAVMIGGTFIAMKGGMNREQNGKKVHKMTEKDLAATTHGMPKAKLKTAIPPFNSTQPASVEKPKAKTETEPKTQTPPQQPLPAAKEVKQPKQEQVAINVPKESLKDAGLEKEKFDRAVQQRVLALMAEHADLNAAAVATLARKAEDPVERQALERLAAQKLLEEGRPEGTQDKEPETTPPGKPAQEVLSVTDFEKLCNATVPKSKMGSWIHHRGTAWELQKKFINGNGTVQTAAVAEMRKNCEFLESNNNPHLAFWYYNALHRVSNIAVHNGNANAAAAAQAALEGMKRTREKVERSGTGAVDDGSRGKTTPNSRTANAGVISLVHNDYTSANDEFPVCQNIRDVQMGGEPHPFFRVPKIGNKEIEEFYVMCANGESNTNKRVRLSIKLPKNAASFEATYIVNFEGKEGIDIRVHLAMADGSNRPLQAISRQNFGIGARQEHVVSPLPKDAKSIVFVLGDRDRNPNNNQFFFLAEPVAKVAGPNQ